MRPIKMKGGGAGRGILMEKLSPSLAAGCTWRASEDGRRRHGLAFSSSLDLFLGLCSALVQLPTLAPCRRWTVGLKMTGERASPPAWCR
ncbi:hypothetical protein PVAP13_3NG140940 [Panicum virgatum]|uniref:Uncharacterized protein n=1 Tax=Panicum virgatum TaxID=38727 RepID=A0A8T0UBP5_PANVG|nr:hypothetical protein PVAP13_3NG140940 [Panicum virgatum]